MPAHAKETDSRDKYGLLVVWVLVVSVCLIMLFTSFVVGLLSSLWIGLVVGLAAALTSAQLIRYTKDLISKTS